MKDLISRAFMKSLGAKCIATRDERTNELIAIIGIDELPSAQPERKKCELPEEARKSAEEYCEECNHIEMCGWYPYEGCEFRSITQPERKRGRWIRITQGAMPEKYICPFCHRTVESYGPEELLSVRYPYCHCGADMRGDDNEVD